MILASLNIKKQLALPHWGAAIVISTTRSHTHVKKPSTPLALHSQILWQGGGRPVGGGRVGMCHCRREGQFQWVSCLFWSLYQTLNGVAYPPGTYPRPSKMTCVIKNIFKGNSRAQCWISDCFRSWGSPKPALGFFLRQEKYTPEPWAV